MRWINRKHRLQSRLNEKRTVKRFLIIPRTLGIETRWLERVKIEQAIVGNKRTYKWKSIKYKP